MVQYRFVLEPESSGTLADSFENIFICWTAVVCFPFNLHAQFKHTVYRVISG